MKKLFALLLVAIMALSMVACGADKTATTEAPKTDAPAAPAATQAETTVSDEPVTIHCLHYMVEGNKSAGLEKIQAAFSEKYPNVTFENSAYSQGTDYFAQLQTAIASGDMPEIMMGNPGLYTDLIEGGYVMDLTGNAVIEGLGLTQADMGDVSYQGKWYAFPVDFKTWGVYYNKDIFDELNLKVPTTQTQLLEVCKALKAGGYDPWAQWYADGASVDIEMRPVVWTEAIQNGDNDMFEKLMSGEKKVADYPYFAKGLEAWGARMGDKKLVDTMIKDGLWDAYNNYHMGTTAENIADIWGITRKEMDEFAASSQQKTEAAQKAGKFEAEIVPVPVKVKKDIVEFKVDEFPRAGVTAEGISKLKGAFPVGPESPNPQVVHTFEPTGIQETDDKGQQRVTAANASGINDGAAALVLASGEAVEKYGLKPMAKLIGWGQGGVDPKIMGVGPVPASRQALKKAGLTIDDIDLVEANEAFAAQSIAVARELHFDMSKVNVNGGAIALGHPVGASGARIIVTLLHEMQKRPEAKRGLATLCIGGGMGVATIYEKC